MEFGEKVKGFMLSPGETFEKAKGDTLGDGLKYAVVWYAILGLLLGIVFAVVFAALLGAFVAMIPGAPAWLTGLGLILIPIMLVVMIVGGILGLIIGGAWLHLWVYVCGGREGYAQTVKAMAYGGTPGYVLGWIPFLNIIGAIWAFVVSLIGLSRLHGIGIGRALAAYILACVIPVVIYMVVILPILL
jgi:hypothetical protein